MVDEDSKTTLSAPLKTSLTIVMVATGLLVMVIIMSLAVWTAVERGILADMIREHFAALFLVPISYVASLIPVLILNTTAGPIQFTVPGFQFRGAAGPLIFWVICFLAIASAFKMLWQT